MTLRTLAGTQVFEIGLGCMNLSHAYGTPPSAEDGRKILHAALDLGVTHFDTAALYGFGKNEELVGSTLKPHYHEIHLASKCGMQGVDGVRIIDGRPATIRATLEDSLRRLQTDVIDLYYLHRWDKTVPIEDSVGEMAKMVSEGKIKAIGLSEVSAATLRKAHKVHPIAAVQTEYSLWTRNPEIKLLDVCGELECALVAFSPLGRGFLTGIDLSPDNFTPKDIRRNMPRFQNGTFTQNAKLLSKFRQLSRDSECTAAQLALAWLLQKSPNIIPIPGTTSLQHLNDNVAANRVRLDKNVILKLEALINNETINGERYPVGPSSEVDTEIFSFSY